MSSLATAFVAIVPSMEGFETKLKKELAAPLEKAGEEGGEKSGTIFGKVFAGLATVAAVGAGVAIAGLGATMTAGFGRLQNIERARNLLQGVGNDAETVDQVMTDALASVKGTAFGLDEAALVAANAVASGVQPGQDLERQLKLVADMASVTGSSMGEIGDIMGKVNTTNRVTNMELRQLATRGIPVYQYLADQIGVTGDEITEMAANGEISLEQLQSALENNLGGAALKAGETTAGAFANVQASISRVGANLLSGVFAELPNFFQGIITALEPLEAVAKEVGAQFAEAMVPALEMLVDLLPDLLEAIIPILPSLAELAGAMLTLALQVLPYILQVLPYVIDALAGLLRFVAELPAWFSKNKDTLMPWIVALGTAAAVIGAFAVAANAAAIATGIYNAVMKVARAVQFAFNLVMAANPIMLVVAAVAALVAGLIYFFTQTEAGQRAWAAFTEGLSALWGGIVIAFQGLGEHFRNLWAGIQAFWDGVKAFFQGFKDGFVAVLDGIGDAVDNFATWVKEGIQNAWQAVTDFFTNMATAILDILSNAGQWLMDTGKNIIDGLWGGIQLIWKTVTNFYLTMGTVILGWLRTAGTWLIGIGRNIIDGLWSGIQFLWRSVTTFFTTMRSVVLGWLSDAINWLITTGRNVIDGLWNGLKAVWATVSGWFRGLPQAIVGFFGNAGNMLLSIGRGIINGLFNGLKNAWTAVANWVTGRVKWIIDSFKSALKIGSPSRVFKEFGENIGEGLLLGMKSMDADIDSQVLSLVSLPKAPDMGELSTRQSVLHYHAAPNQSFDSQQQLFQAMRRARLVTQW